MGLLSMAADATTEESESSSSRAGNSQNEHEKEKVNGLQEQDQLRLNADGPSVPANGNILIPRANGVTSPPRRLTRAKTEIDLGKNADGITDDAHRGGSGEQNWELRHGWEEQYNSEEYLHSLSSAFYMYYTDKRHETDGKPKSTEDPRPPPDWSLRDKTKTMAAALVVCLNLGVDPPDVIKPHPCATTECWIDPNTMTTSSAKILEAIGKKLQEQFESLSIKTRYKQQLDPSFEETRRFCTALRRNAKEERVLFYYNGHGVPRPTPSGEVWVFNRDYTQYIPIGLYDLQSWLGGPALCIYDCSHAGNVVANYERYVQKHEEENRDLRNRDPDASVQNYSGNIHLAACGKTEQLPTNPDLPADLFTCCLTTPIDISLRFHVMQNPLHHNRVSFEDLAKVPGKASERRSPMGELNWILTAITDTIAWNALPRELFRKLFRQDLMVAALFRNYLVAERIMTAYGCHPTTIPKMPSTHEHPLWESWDLAVEMVVSQLPDMLASANGGTPYEYKPSNFFGEQLIAFEHYLQQGAPKRELPTQLPVVLQVLLSQAHRLKALVLLSKFLDLGPWAVNLALNIGIFPYVVKLLQSPAIELKPIMIFIWARIMAVAAADSKTDLLRDNNYAYFTNVLVPRFTIPIDNLLEHKAMCAFVTAMFCRDFRQAQETCQRRNVMDSLIEHLRNDENSLLRQWTCLAISMLWKDFPEGKWAGIRCLAHVRLCALVVDPIPEVRTAAIHALTSFIGIPDLTESVAQNEELVASALMVMTTDGSVMVRRELLVFYSAFVKRYRNKFLVAAFESLVEERDYLVEGEFPNHKEKAVNGTAKSRLSWQILPSTVSKDSVQGAIWYQLLTMTVDAHPDIAQTALSIVETVLQSVLDSPLSKDVNTVLDTILDSSPPRPRPSSRAPSAAPSFRQSGVESPALVNGNHSPPKSEGYFSLGFRRTASVAAALKHLVGGSSNDSPNRGNGSGGSRPSSRQSKSFASTPGRAGLPDEWSQRRDGQNSQKVQIANPKHFEHRDTTSMTLDDFPLPSTFLEYSIEYFLEPQMKPNEPDEPGSDDYNRRLWRRERNDKILSSTQPLKSIAGSSKWDIDAGFFNNATQPSKMTFHQFEDHLAVADDKDGISVWNWRHKVRLSCFSNRNPAGSKINEARFINEDDQALLITGSSDGVVRIFRDYDRDVELVSAFRALTEMVPSTKNAGLVFEWQQGQGRLLVAGDVKVIRVWDAATELCISDIPARSGSCITSLTSDQVAGYDFAAGYGDGAVRIFDQRMKPAMAQARVWREHKQWITTVHLQRGGQRELVSGSRDGEIRLWDIRMDKSIQQVRAPGTLRTLAVHEHAPVFATGSENHALTLFNMNGAFLSTLHPYSPLLSTNRSTPITSTAFHPHRMLLAAGSVGSSWINVYTCGEGKGFAD